MKEPHQMSRRNIDDDIEWKFVLDGWFQERVWHVMQVSIKFMEILFRIER